jgi:hypothetical protein
MTTKLSDDGRHYWDGTQWLSAISTDGRWRWDGNRWIPRDATATFLQSKKYRLGAWIGAGLSAILTLICLLGLTASVGEWSQGSLAAPSSFGVALIFISLAILFISPLVLRFAIQRGVVLAASLATALLFLGSCGGGIALTAAFPPPASPSPVAQSTTASKSPRIPDTGPASSTPTTALSPSLSPSPLHSPSPSPHPSLAPSPSPVATPPPPPPPPAAGTCGAPSNPWGYNFCGRGSYITNPPADFCSYFYPCVSTFWTATRGYVVECASGSWSHSGGVSGACSKNGGVARILYSGP